MKRKILLVYVLVAFVVLCTNVYAIVSVELNLIADKTTIKQGDDVTITVELNNLSAAVSSIEGYINIDENVLKEISSDMIVANDDGKIEVTSGDKVTNALTYAFDPDVSNADYDVIFNTSETATNGNDVFFVMDFKKDIEEDSKIITLKYKVKETAQNAEVSNAVKLDCIVAYSANTSDKSKELTANLDIKVSSTADEENENKDVNNDTNNTTNEENTNTNNTNVNNTNTNTNNTNTNTNKNTNTNNTNTNTNKNTNTNTNNNTNKNTNVTTVGATANTVDNTVAATRIPAAGLKTVIIPIVLFMILAYVSYTKYISYKDV